MLLLEGENYAAMRSRPGIFDPTPMRKRLLEEHPDAATIVYHYSRSSLAGFLRFEWQGEDVRVLSLQLAGNHIVGMRALVGKFYRRLSQLRFRNLCGEVYIDNQRSLTLHRHLGCIQVDSDGIKVIFATPKDVFLSNLRRFLPRRERWDSSRDGDSG